MAVRYWPVSQVLFRVEDVELTSCWQVLFCHALCRDESTRQRNEKSWSRLADKCVMTKLRHSDRYILFWYAFDGSSNTFHVPPRNHTRVRYKCDKISKHDCAGSLSLGTNAFKSSKNIIYICVEDKDSVLPQLEIHWDVKRWKLRQTSYDNILAPSQHSTKTSEI